MTAEREKPPSDQPQAGARFIEDPTRPLMRRPVDPACLKQNRENNPMQSGIEVS